MKFSLNLLGLLAFYPLVALSDVLISDLRVKALIPGQAVTAAYFDIENQGEESVTLISVKSSDAEKVSMHDHQMREGMMSMIELDSVELASRNKVVFAEGGLHLMVYTPQSQIIESGEMEFVFGLSDGTEITQKARTEFRVPNQQPIHHH